MPDGVLEQRVEREVKPFPVGAHGDGVKVPDPQPLRDGGPPAADQAGDHLVKLHVLGVQERRVAGRHDEQEPLGDPAQPAQLADDDLDVLVLLLAADGPREQLGVPERDRDRGPQLVCGVLEKAPLRGE